MTKSAKKICKLNQCIFSHTDRSYCIQYYYNYITYFKYNVIVCTVIYSVPVQIHLHNFLAYCRCEDAATLCTLSAAINSHTWWLQQWCWVIDCDLCVPDDGRKGNRLMKQHISTYSLLRKKIVILLSSSDTTGLTLVQFY